MYNTHMHTDSEFEARYLLFISEDNAEHEADNSKGYPNHTQDGVHNEQGQTMFLVKITHWHPI